MVWQRYFELIPEKVPLKKCEELERTAFHESGHAIIGCIYGFTLKMVTIIKQDDTLGSVEYAQGYEVLDYLYPKEFEKTFWAGFLAEYLFSGNWNEAGASSDRDSMSQYFYLPEENADVADKHFEKIFMDVYSLLKTPAVWNMVEIFAKELIAKKTLAQEDFVRLFPDFKIPSLDL